MRLKEDVFKPIIFSRSLVKKIIYSPNFTTNPIPVVKEKAADPRKVRSSHPGFITSLDENIRALTI